MSVTRRVVLLGVFGSVVAGCVGGGGGFETQYDPLPPEVTRDWRLAELRVDVPRTLVVSEAKTLLPDADIVWREDPLGDRYDQVAKIMQNAISRGAQGLLGGRPVIIDVTVTRFHALTYEAELRGETWGVHNIDFTAQVLDARSGAVLLARTLIRAELPALSGQEMKSARARGETQKSQITAHVAQTVAGWLGIGPDNRVMFNRRGN